MDIFDSGYVKIDQLYEAVAHYSEDHGIKGRLLMLPVIALDTIAVPTLTVAHTVYQLAAGIYETALWIFSQKSYHKWTAKAHFKDFGLGIIVTLVTIPYTPFHAIITSIYNLTLPTKAKSCFSRSDEEIKEHRELLINALTNCIPERIRTLYTTARA